MDPSSGVIIDNAGRLDGTTEFGGPASATCANNGCGTVFTLTPSAAGQTRWTESSILATSTTGYALVGGLLLTADGVLYGAAEYGGRYDTGLGTVYRVASPGAGAPLAP